MSFRKDLIRNIFITGGYNYSSQILTFLSGIVVSRFIEPATYGFVGIITIFTGFISIFSDSGLSLVVIKTSYRDSFYQSIFNLSFLLGIFLCILTSALAYPIALYFKNPNLCLPTIVMSTNFIFRSLGIVNGALLSKSRNFSFLGKASLISTIIAVVSTITLAFLGAGYWALVIPQILSSIGRNFIITRRVKLSLKLQSPKYLVFAYNNVKKTVGNLLGFNLINYWARNTDNFAIAKFYSQADLGIYSRAYNFLTLPLTLITGMVSSILYPSLNTIKADLPLLKKEYMFILQIIASASLPITVLLVTFPNEVVLTLWGKNWSRVGELLPYFGLLVLSQSLLSTVGNVLILTNHETVLRKSGWIGSAIMVSAISIGAYHSMLAVAQYYSLAFISIVLPFNIVYIYINTLKFEVKKMLIFWGPVVLSSISIWLGCYYQSFYLKGVGLATLLVFFIFSAFLQFKKASKYFKILA